MYDCLDGLTEVSIRSCCQHVILSEGFSLSRLVGQIAVLIRSTPLCVASLASGGIISNRFVALLRRHPAYAKCIGILTTSFLVIVFNFTSISTSTSTSISSTPLQLFLCLSFTCQLQVSLSENFINRSLCWLHGGIDSFMLSICLSLLLAGSYQIASTVG